MGIIYADLRLSNMGKPELEAVTANAIVDTDAIDLVVPEHIAIQLQLTDLKPRELHLADGTRKMVPRTLQVVPNPESPNMPVFLAT